MSMAFDAMVFARVAHSQQRRKYTGNPYWEHLAEVAGIVAAIGLEGGTEFWTHNRKEVAIATAWLHDVVEDCGVTESTLVDRFGTAVAAGVILLSDLEQGNRASRKAASRARLAAAPGWVQSIKCADLISNTSSIVQHDPQFARVYLEEKRQLLDVMTQADPRLLYMARGQLPVTTQPAQAPRNLVPTPA